MAQPEKISKKLGETLIRRLQNSDYIGFDEELDYHRQMKDVGKIAPEDVQAWAFYYALRKNESEALKYFKRSIGFGIVGFIENYLAYLLRISQIREFIKVALSLRTKCKGEKNIMIPISMALNLNGDIDGFRENMNSLILLKNDEHESYQSHLDHFNSFIENTNLTEDSFKSLMDTYVSMGEKNKLIYSGISFESYPEFNIHEIEVSVYLPENDIEKLVDLNVELAFELGKLPTLDSKVFSASFEFYEA